MADMHLPFMSSDDMELLTSPSARPGAPHRRQLGDRLVRLPLQARLRVALVLLRVRAQPAMLAQVGVSAVEVAHEA